MKSNKRTVFWGIVNASQICVMCMGKIDIAHKSVSRAFREHLYFLNRIIHAADHETCSIHVYSGPEWSFLVKKMFNMAYFFGVFGGF